MIFNQVDLNPRDDLGFTPLHYAVKFGNLSVCKILIESGAEKDLKTNNGLTPLKMSIDNHHTELKTFLHQWLH